MFGLGLRWADDGATRWANILPKWLPQVIESQDSILTHLRPVKGYLAFTYFIKNQSIGMPWDTLDYLF